MLELCVFWISSSLMSILAVFFILFFWGLDYDKLGFDFIYLMIVSPSVQVLSNFWTSSWKKCYCVVVWWSIDSFCLKMLFRFSCSMKISGFGLSSMPGLNRCSTLSIRLLLIWFYVCVLGLIILFWFTFFSQNWIKWWNGCGFLLHLLCSLQFNTFRNNWETFDMKGYWKMKK